MITEPLELAAAPPTRNAGLVRPLPQGPLDVVGDIHGEIGALSDLMEKLGYNEVGEHPEGRRLIFLGDLVDRGPDSAGVVEFVMAMVARGIAYAILGNHELNIMNRKKADHNAWFFGSDKPELAATSIGEERASRLLGFMKSLPLAMERDDLRVAHAAWHTPSIELLRQENDAITLFERYKDAIKAELNVTGIVDPLEAELAYQNRNPVKMITSGPETRAPESFLANGKVREATRVRWWDDYREEAFVVFGHYWRNAPADFQKGPNLFDGYDAHHILGAGNAISIDYSVGARQYSKGVTRLAALRWPERKLVFDDGEEKAIALRSA